MDKLVRYSRILNWATAISMVALLAMVFLYAPVERTMGNVHRILYFHVGTAWAALLTFGIALIAGVMYLRKPSRKLDIVSMASAEVGLVFITMTIAAGSVWGRPAWGTWWDWSPRLTSVTVMWLVYVAYFVLRSAIPDPEKRARFAAVYVIAAFVTVLLTYTSVRFLRDIHPTVVGPVTENVAKGNAAQGASELGSGIASARMGQTLGAATAVFTLVYVAWLTQRYRLEVLSDHVERLKYKLSSRPR